MPMVSVVLPTHNRPELLRCAIISVRAQTYTDWELIVVDDGSIPSAQNIVEGFHDPRIRFIRHELPRGGGAARNAGIKAVHGEYVAFLDDDDEWAPEKLMVQMGRFTATGPEVGFCFSAVTNVYDDHRERTIVLDGIRDHFIRALGNPKGYLTVTLVVKRSAFDDAGVFDESFPSHQEAELVIRLAKRFKGLGVNQPLVLVNMRGGYERVGTALQRRIAGRNMLVEKHIAELREHPAVLAAHYFQLGLWHRDLAEYRDARHCFWRAFTTHPSLRLLMHAVSMIGGGRPYVFVKGLGVSRRSA